jgi:hypothetical protein
VEGNFGKVIGREGDVMQIEVPAYVAIGLNSIWGEGRFPTQYVGQLTRLAPRRIADINGNTVVCSGRDHAADAAALTTVR